MKNKKNYYIYYYICKTNKHNLCKSIILYMEILAEMRKDSEPR